MAITVFITGTSSGIGRATATLFQAEGWNVVATMRSPEKESELKRPDRVQVARLDVTDDATINQAVAAAMMRVLASMGASLRKRCGALRRSAGVPPPPWR